MSFDAEVKAGEVRVFADTKGPLVALVLEGRGPAGFRIVPVSPYRVPANDREIAVGERVFQLWNVCTVAKGFAVRSWVADTLSAETAGDVRRAVAEKGGLPDRLGEYERRHLVPAEGLRRHIAICPEPSVPMWRRYGGWSIAAAVVVGLGVGWMLVREDPGSVAEGQRVVTVQLARQERYPDLDAAEGEVAEAPEPMPEVEVEVPRVEPPRIAKVVPAPDVRKAYEVAKAAPAAPARLAPLPPNAVVAGKRDAGAREPEVVQTLEWLRKSQKPDGSWGEKPLKDTALAVLALMAHGETADSAAYGRTLVGGVRYLTEAKLDGKSRGEVQIAACALCGASAAVRNPNVRTAAERALASIGDNRSVEAGRDWRGLLVDLATPVVSQGNRQAAGHSDGDSVADACILVLQLLK